jgi:hypothetical protein
MKERQPIKAIGCLLFTLLPPVARQSNHFGLQTNSTFTAAG